MSDNLGATDNNFLKSLNSTVMKDTWMNTQLNTSKAEQKSELKKVFTVIDDNNVTGDEKKALEARAAVLETKLRQLEDQMQSLKGEIAQCQDEIASHANEIADLIAAAEKKSSKMEEDTRTWVKACIDDVFYEYSRGIVEKDEISTEIRKRIRSSSIKSNAANAVERILQRLKDKESEVSSLIDGATKWADKSNELDAKYGLIKATYDMTRVSLDQIGNTNTVYKNSDYDTNMPVYSLDKTKIVSDLFDNPAYNVQAGPNKNYVEGSTKDTAPVDIVSSKKSKKSSVVSSKNDGSKITTVTEVTTTTTTTGFKKNSWDPNKGNTIDSNSQLKALSENYISIIDKLAKGEPPFSFKEGMYALFNDKTGLFKDCGVNYDISKLKDGQPTYSIDDPGDQATANFYKSLADKIYAAWGVKLDSDEGLKGIVSETSTTKTKKKVQKLPPPPPPEENHDPLTFRVGDTEYAFIIDKNNDGAFSDQSEFVGGDKASSWLDDLRSLDTDGDGILNQEELKNLKVLGSTYTDNAAVEKSGEFLRGTTNDIAYILTDAAALGISEINLNQVNTVNSSTGKHDINGSELFNDSITFKLNGEDITASRKDDTTSFMDTVYKDAYGKSFKIGLSDAQADDIINNAYKEYSNQMAEFEKTFSDLNVLKNLPQINAQARQMFDQALERTNSDEIVLLTRANNRATALSNNVKGWSQMQNEIIARALSRGVEVEMDQVKGIYTMNGGETADEVIDTYLEQKARLDKIESERGVSKEAWASITECARNNIKTTTSEIMDLLVSGKAKDAKEVVEILKQKQEKNEK